MQERTWMSLKELKRAYIVQQLQHKEIPQKQAAEMMGVSRRQVPGDL